MKIFDVLELDRYKNAIFSIFAGALSFGLPAPKGGGRRHPTRARKKGRSAKKGAKNQKIKVIPPYIKFWF